MPKVKTPTPSAVSRSVSTIGDHLGTWRKLRGLTAAEVADRAGIDARTVLSLEHGKGATLENVLRVARALGVLDVITESLDPYNSDVGRMRADELLPTRVRKSTRP